MSTTSRAVVIGGSIAGLLAACALRETYDEVIDWNATTSTPLPLSGRALHRPGTPTPY